jgi:hypothetical protein
LPPSMIVARPKPFPCTPSEGVPPQRHPPSTSTPKHTRPPPPPSSPAVHVGAALPPSMIVARPSSAPGCQKHGAHTNPCQQHPVSKRRDHPADSSTHQAQGVKGPHGSRQGWGGGQSAHTNPCQQHPEVRHPADNTTHQRTGFIVQRAREAGLGLRDVDIQQRQQHAIGVS